MRTSTRIPLVLLLAVLLSAPAASPAAMARPNILLILADDLGYGDVSCYNPPAKFRTPNVDRLASQGTRFTDAHTPTSVCTPTRYGILTGRHSWRTRLQRGVLNEYDLPLIAAGRLTVPALLARYGYDTACVGKWHLGFDWDLAGHDRSLFGYGYRKGAPAAATEAHLAAWRAVFARPLTGGPVDRGFHSYFGTDVPNMPPYGFIRDDRLVAVPTVWKSAGDISDTGHATTTGPAGPMVQGWEFDRILPALVEESTGYLGRRAADRKPFFLYVSLTSPHFPVLPSAVFRGRSGICPLADFILETDDALGQVMAALDRQGLAEDTILIFTSDNGPAHNSRTPLDQAGHRGSGPLRGAKASIYEGGHRVPFIVRWPGRTPAGAVSDETICQTALLATCADLLGAKLPDDAGEDSRSILPLLRGEKPAEPTHPFVVHNPGAPVFAIRRGPWKLIAMPDGKDELYDLATDLAETTNVLAGHPEMAAELTRLLARSISSGRTTPGAAQSNDVPVALRTAGAPVNDRAAPASATPAPQDAPRPAGAIGIVKNGGAWWFASPGGARFLSIGMNHIEPVYWQSPNNTQFVGQTYGPDLFRPDGEFNDGSAAAAKWAGRAAANLKSWGFNTLGMHNPPLESLRSIGDACYVVELGVAVPWGWNMKRSELVRAFARRPMDVFADAFVTEAGSVAARCVKPVAGDPRVLGYAYSDGPPWTIDDDAPGEGKLHPWVLAVMALPAEAPGKQAWLAMMKERYPSAAAAGAVYGHAPATWEDLASATAWDAVPDMPAALADSRAFLERLMRRWYEVLRDAIREHDPHHLIFGDKLNANRDARHPADMAWSLGVVKDYVDVIFVQYYAPIEEQRGTLAAIHAATRKPVLVGDTACRPLWKDCAPDDVEYYGELGRVYADHVTGLFSLPYVVGWHHCGYMRGLRPPYVAALKRGDRKTVEFHLKQRTTLREGFIGELETPIDPLLTPLRRALSTCEAVHRASVPAGGSQSAP